ncbi:hypothetical protein I6F35_20145 [Bradyrhizobium sp. BRP22]|uniref:hypothetical protein n=1 Tax=Bradyrhizobium sp. BRP22 TaxID=2793821 RepID=UPI001CD614FF|nr:hypothetical protein [Bradyrhizobium sp. BRP22]MCA1455493.1 hypothetical protein [Bradyrhizobium sp. BRP22]
MKLLTWYTGQPSKLTLDRRIIEISERALELKTVEETKRLRFRAFSFAFVVFLNEHDLGLLELDADFFLSDGSPESDEGAIAATGPARRRS